MYTIHIQYALLPNATLPLISLRQNDKKIKLCAVNFNLIFMIYKKNNGFYMKILFMSLESSSQPKSCPLQLQQKVTFSSLQRTENEKS